MSVLNTVISQYKSTPYEICRTLLNSRTRKAALLEQQTAEVERLRQENSQLALQLKNAQDAADINRQLYEKELAENRRLKERPICLPSDLPLPGHTYGVKLICVCVNLAKRIGFRAANAALKIVFEFLGIKAKIPSHDSIRSWACRIGVAILSEKEQTSEGEIWISDHTNQVGQDKVLTISRLRQEDIPPPGKTLARSKLKVIAVVVSKSSKRGDVRHIYDIVAKERGAPTWLITDGAVELHESADALDKHAKSKVRRLRDIKHKGANILESVVGKDPRFAHLLSKIGLTRCQIQQTELSHFLPPSLSTKSRFMNLEPHLKWINMVSYNLSCPYSIARKGITAKRMNEKLGWLRAFRNDIARWSECYAVLQHCLTNLEHNAVTTGTVDSLRESLQEKFGNLQECAEISQQMAERLLESILEIESQLKPGERVWALSDILESIFGGFKRLERQHSKGGFTSLVAALPIVTETLTPERVRECLALVSVNDLKEWVQTNLGETVAAKRQAAFREYSRYLAGLEKHRV